jgi:hypothetical protein
LPSANRCSPSRGALIPGAQIGGRDCGTCTACCEYLNIEGDEFHKPAGELCRHCTGTACAIYAARPSVCRDYYCGWQQVAALDDEWRPDRSGVLLLPLQKDPAGAAPQGMDIMILGGEAAVRRPQLASFVALLVSRGAPVFMTVAGRQALLNPTLETAVAARDREGVRQLLTRLYAGATTHSGSQTLPPI